MSESERDWGVGAYITGISAQMEKRMENDVEAAEMLGLCWDTRGLGLCLLRK